MSKQMKLIHKPTFDERLQKLSSKFGVKGHTQPDLFGKVCRKWAENTGISKFPKVLSLFTGGGGLDLAFHDAGFKIRVMVEADKRFCKTLEHNCSSSGYFGDGCKVEPVDIKDYEVDADNYDFVIGGPPCQSFSAAGRRAAGVLGIDSEKGRLFEQYVRVLKEARPKGFLFENVYGLREVSGGVWERIKETFRGAGYELSCMRLDSADYGVPQHRVRLFGVGMKEGCLKFPKPTHGPDSGTSQGFYSAREAIKGVEKKTEPKDVIGGRYGDLLEEIPPGLNYSYYTDKLGHPDPRFAWRSKFSDFLYKADPERPVRTIKAKAGLFTGPLHWENRHFTIEELKRLQTIPDAYELKGNESIKREQIGNSVPPNIGRVLALTILAQLFLMDIPLKLEYLRKGKKLGFLSRKRKLTDYYRKLAISSHQRRKPKKRTRIESCTRSFSIDKFDIKEQETGEGEFQVSSKTERKEGKDNLILDVKFPGEPLAQVKIELFPKETWELPVEKIKMSGNSSRPLDITSIWKACEWHINKYFLMDDLVQLYGYYQYPPKFDIKMSCEEACDWGKIEILNRIYEGNMCGFLVSAPDLAASFSIPEERLLSTAKWLKSLGYEIRNNNTNPTIKDGYYLIPYPFPTMYSKSVQLHKSLG